ncbi:conserved protein of unknown function [Bradyrhizobium sp. ORS 285]|uniref:hypothetical protein n=2 Tax=Bradyrhizobium sp. ORS 285 TaxID=115808 RepID=UPI000B40C9D5|nr:hypothetical protein [Bradyrhizobium sp. ORS 285]SMX61364.1 conserved protein of unknown function [Bradyrhizobium sp. ORS 285]
MTTHVNKVHHVTTIAKVAKDLGEDEEWLHDVASELDIEDGVIWVYGGCLRTSVLSAGERTPSRMPSDGVAVVAETTRRIRWRESPNRMRATA